MAKNDSYSFKTPIGVLTISAENNAITQVSLQNHSKSDILLPASVIHSDILYEAYKQLEEYFAGNRQAFDLPLSFKGTEFQQKVWHALQDIPYGETWSYQGIAVHIDNPKAVRAVGQANNKNSIIIIVPCHRVINKNGSLGGFGCGVDVKRYLLELEGHVLRGDYLET